MSSNEDDLSSSDNKPNRSFKCTVAGCDASFSKNSKLVFHTRKHTGERPYVCDEDGCNKTYTNSSHLRRHKKVSHGEKKSEEVVCEYEGCGVVLANKYSLKKHCSRKHNPENHAFKCNDCTQSFPRKTQLQQHSYLHTGEAPFKCDKCQWHFTRNRDLNRHKRSHCTYTCDCGETFDRWSLLLKHKKKSCRSPRYKCEICNKSFSHLGNYKNHKSIHEDPSRRPLLFCPYSDCQRFYLYKTNLTVHINNFHKKVNENNELSCTYPGCKVVLKTRQSLKQHFITHFTWKKKKERKPRSDKGKPRKPMASLLCSFPTSTECSDSDSSNGDSDNDINDSTFSDNNVDDSTNDDTDDNIDDNTVSDDLLLKKCDVVLAQLSETATETV